ncbi:MAG: hypothetical protein J6T71_05995 [Paludibacteraceae bacterium]|nr:hypothetical protein [Paludibacteraceae bacterium]
MEPGGKQVEGREMRGKSRDYHPAQQTKTGFALSREEANKEDGSELSLGEAGKEEDGEAANKRKKANFALSREEADKEGEDSELADDGG